MLLWYRYLFYSTCGFLTGWPIISGDKERTLNNFFIPYKGIGWSAWVSLISLNFFTFCGSLRIGRKMLQNEKKAYYSQVIKEANWFLLKSFKAIVCFFLVSFSWPWLNSLHLKKRKEKNFVLNQNEEYSLCLS